MKVRLYLKQYLNHDKLLDLRWFELLSSQISLLSFPEMLIEKCHLFVPWLLHSAASNTQYSTTFGNPSTQRAWKPLLHGPSASHVTPNLRKEPAPQCSYLMMMFLFISWMSFLFKLPSICWWGSTEITCYCVICKTGKWNPLETNDSCLNDLKQVLKNKWQRSLYC